MKKLKVFLITLIFLLTSCSKTFATQPLPEDFNPFEAINESANDIGGNFINHLKATDSKHYSVDVIKIENVYYLTLNGVVTEVPYTTNEDEAHASFNNIETFQYEGLEQLRQNICLFINKASFFYDEDKPMLTSKINNIPIYLADIVFDNPMFNGSAIAIYDVKSDSIYFSRDFARNREQMKEMGAFLLTHEFIHAICNHTNPNGQNELFAADVFNEILTNIIAKSISPNSRTETMLTAYELYEHWVYAYLSIVGVEFGIKSYFYGYETSPLDITEIEFFSIAITLQCTDGWQKIMGESACAVILLSWHYETTTGRENLFRYFF